MECSADRPIGIPGAKASFTQRASHGVVIVPCVPVYLVDISTQAHMHPKTRRAEPMQTSCRHVSLCVDRLSPDLWRLESPIRVPVVDTLSDVRRYLPHDHQGVSIDLLEGLDLDADQPAPISVIHAFDIFLLERSLVVGPWHGVFEHHIVDHLIQSLQPLVSGLDRFQSHLQASAR
jgi:hypothetical protein